MANINEDTVALLQHCSEGIDMALETIEMILPHLSIAEMTRDVMASREAHQRLRSEIALLLSEAGEKAKDAGIIPQSMGRVKTGMRLAFKDDTATSADELIQGCDMGVRTLSRYLNQYRAADADARNLTRRLIGLEEELSRQMRPYL